MTVLRCDHSEGAFTFSRSIPSILVKAQSGARLTEYLPDLLDNEGFLITDECKDGLKVNISLAEDDAPLLEPYLAATLDYISMESPPSDTVLGTYNALLQIVTVEDEDVILEELITVEIISSILTVEDEDQDAILSFLEGFSEPNRAPVFAGLSTQLPSW